MNSANVGAEIQLKLLNERTLSTGKNDDTLKMAVLEECLNQTDIEKVG